ncbi:MAG: arylsulfatase [Lentisphaeria bacterium]|nr:arylsulfatase [Lentisphaeria bacterium]
MPQCPPNIVFILADDLGYGDLGFLGNDTVRTPNLDALAAGGACLTQHYSASPLCAPARAALLTGRYNHRTGAVDVPSNRGLDRIALAERTIADLFSAHGYATGMVGKWHNGLHDSRYHPNARGFSEFAGFLNGGMDYYRWVLDRNGSAESADGRYLTDVFTEEARAFVRRHRAHPFFLYLAYNAPHAPYQAPEALVQRYRETGRFTEEVCQLYAMIERMDDGIGKLLDELTAQGLRDNTIVVFTSDNGPYLGGQLNRYNGPFRGAKGDVLDGGIRVPCMIRWPDGLPGGANLHAMTHFCDWLPTLAALATCKSPMPLPLDGCDLSPLLRNEMATNSAVRFWQRNRYKPMPHCNGAMRDGPWKLLWPMREGADRKDPRDNEPYQHGLTAAHRIMPIAPELPNVDIGPPAPPQLFHIDDDPHEDHDLAGDHPQRVESMTRAWDTWFEEVSSEWLAAWRENTAR